MICIHSVYKETTYPYNPSLHRHCEGNTIPFSFGALTLIPPLSQASSLVRKPAPDFKTKALVNGDFKTVSLSDYKGKYLVLFFYPLDFTFVCPTEIIEFSNRVGEFNKLGIEVVGCSIDSEYAHLQWTKQSRNDGGIGEMKIPLLADVNKTIAKVRFRRSFDDRT